MTIKVGEIIPKGKAVRQNHKGWLIKAPDFSNIKLWLDNDCYSAPVKKGDSINNLVIIRIRKDNINVAVHNYDSELVDYYYNSHLWPNKDRWKQWDQQWKTDFAYPVFIDNYYLQKANIKRKLFIYRLRGCNFCLPVCGSPQLKFLSGQEKLMPEFFSDKTNTGVVSIYKDDCNKTIFPIVYKGKLTSSDQAVFIYLHWKTNPLKWHNIVKRHFSDNTVDTIFQKRGCKLRTNMRGQINCDASHCRREGLFEKVHPEIKDKCKEVQNKVVTIFNKTPTFIVEKVDKADNKINLIFQDDRYRMSINGICYDWDNIMPTLHVSPKTIYPSRRNAGAKIDELKIITRL